MKAGYYWSAVLGIIMTSNFIAPLVNYAENNHTKFHHDLRVASHVMSVMANDWPGTWYFSYQQLVHVNNRKANMKLHPIYYLRYSGYSQSSMPSYMHEQTRVFPNRNHIVLLWHKTRSCCLNKLAWAKTKIEWKLQMLTRGSFYRESIRLRNDIHQILWKKSHINHKFAAANNHLPLNNP